MNNVREHEFLLRCECGTTSHSAWFLNEVEDEDPRFNDWYLMIGLNDFPFWKRLGVAIKYLFKRPQPWGQFGELVLTDADMTRLANWIMDRQAAHCAKHSKRDISG